MKTEYGPSILIGKFIRNGNATDKTRLFADFSANIQNCVLKHITLANDEQPLVLFFDNEHLWLLVTTHGINWKNDGLHYLHFIDIKSIEIDLKKNADFFKSKEKGYYKFLIAQTTDGRVYELEIEPDKGFNGLYNVLTGCALSHRR